ncbi:hypothetical protein [Amycolatopsis keratiniphila]|uniref:Uncharacterized protein n=1 Tax=Amycolatopsis keratiniphila subsp. keratiniphila TaxID=227715 RepID=A0A1W2LPL5_9PSEU|nr:hypothetical protein [Amycolatopsis keratiniphila]OLZ56970.1 hypothetical protein BS330_16375 [Amycolatopsis keratiniphila subsp. nogabecina]ONF65589.1 hypothetical protein AVR91_0226985 [Amycolatopsis keratiniphila subsp. keratiniphila]SDU48926.1 hypothetical protein SAMN04489733_4937 [Amycolatopsis keratiniphila]
MTDERLVGLWSDEIVHPGSVESVDLAFLDNGSGWLYWSSWSSEFAVSRFTWATPDELVLNFHRALGGTWSIEDGVTCHEVESDEKEESVIRLGYEIAPGEDPFGNPVTLLSLDRPLDDHLAGSRFARVEKTESLSDPSVDAPRPDPSSRH